MTRVMLCFGSWPMDLQALCAAQDRQCLCPEELTPCTSQVLGQGCGGADWLCCRGGLVLAGAGTSRGTALCKAVCWLSPRKVHGLKRRGRRMTHVTAGLQIRQEGNVQCLSSELAVLPSLKHFHCLELVRLNSSFC